MTNSNIVQKLWNLGGAHIDGNLALIQRDYFVSASIRQGNQFRVVVPHAVAETGHAAGAGRDQVGTKSGLGRGQAGTRPKLPPDMNNPQP